TPANHLLGVRVASLPTVGTLTNHSVAVSVGQTISAADLAAGNLRYVPPANMRGSPLDLFTFQVQDDGGTALGGVNVDPVPKTVKFNVRAFCLLPPGPYDFGYVTTLEDTTYAFRPGDFPI